jgi:hypothetical protein
MFVDHSELTDDSFLMLRGLELEVGDPYVRGSTVPRRWCHMCLIALEPDNYVQPMWNRKAIFMKNQYKNLYKIKVDENEPQYEKIYTPEGVSEMMHIGREKGFFVTYNHPAWSGEDGLRYCNYDGMHAMEMCNYAAWSGGWDEYNPKIYDDILRTGKRIYCISADDNHDLGSSFGAFTVIKADKLEYRTITKAMEDGNFYASMGPEIYDLYVEDDMVHIKCSPVKRITYNTGARCYAQRKNAPEGGYLTEVSFKIRPSADIYFRLSIYDETGLAANTNAYFCDELFGTDK